MGLAKIENNSVKGRTSHDRGVDETDPRQSDLHGVLLSSQTRLRVAELVSRRPRTLRELAKLTNLSVPGVLRHIEAMNRVGLIREEKVATKTFPARKVYSLKGTRVMDFSARGLTILKVATENAANGEKGARDLERQAMDILVSRRRIKEKVRRLARAIDELEEQERMLTREIDDLELTDEERLILLTVFTEDTVEEGERVLTRLQGMKEARRSIDRALAKVRRIGGK